ncbi:hypothetical protein [Parasulfitobacter algicola]|uniref:Uncharacterized protein n=1 Tax=Parasulfitobacter algicola TaxID=2614809 RepID=A0ABX2IVB1_9RHOB|nr:hypothetical protein [Sulfitobacter algicola]NSX54133.1 hypothetical protein [Sulfitobacter algicola]
MTKPIFKVISGPSPTMDGIAKAITWGLAPVLSAGSKAADQLPHDSEGLLQILHFRNQTAKSAHQRSGWIGGRLFNKFSGEDANYIPISGMHLRQTLTVVGIEPPDFVISSGQYQLRTDISQDAVAILSKVLNISMPAQP